MKRCTLVGLVAMVVAGLSLAPVGLRAADAVKRDDSASEKLGLKLSLQCWTFNKLSFFECIDKAAGLGVKYVEMFPGQKLKPGSNNRVGKNMSAADCEEALKKLSESGVKLVAYGVDGIAGDEAGARKEFEWAKKMGIQVIVTESTPNAIHDKLTAEYNIRLALHNHPNTWPPDAVLKACEGKRKLVGSCSDTGHWMRRNLVPAEALKKLEGRVLHSHFKDLDQMGNGHDVPWGTGKGNAAASLAELKRQGFNGYLSIEYEYGDLKHLDENLPKCVEFFDKTCAELAK